MADRNPDRPSLFDVTGKVIVLTGGTGLLGTRYCQVLAESGAVVVIADLGESEPAARATDVAARTGAKVLGVACDVGDQGQVQALFSSTMSVFGRVDVVVNNAAATGEHLMRAGAVFAKFEEYPLEVWEQVLRTNLTGAFLVAREGGKCLLAGGGGSLINVSSLYGVRGPDHRLYDGMPFSSFAPYSASKAGVHGLTLWLATYWGRSGIRVNTVVPGGVFNNHDPEFVRRYAARTPMGRMADPDDLVGTIVYLSSEASRYCTGQQFIVDGGVSAW